MNRPYGRVQKTQSANQHFTVNLHLCVVQDLAASLLAIGNDGKIIVLAIAQALQAVFSGTVGLRGPCVPGHSNASKGGGDRGDLNLSTPGPSRLRNDYSNAAVDQTNK